MGQPHHAFATAQIDLVDLGQEPHGVRQPKFADACLQRTDVLGQASAAKAYARVEELAPDAHVMAQRIGQGRDVPANGLGDLGERIDEGNLRGQEGVGRHLHQFGGLEVGDDQRGVRGQGLGVNLAQDLHRFGVLRANDQAVRGHGVGHGKAFAQEFRVPGQHDPGIRVRFGLDQRLQAPRGSDGHRRLAHDEGFASNAPGQFADRRIDVAQVGAVAVGPLGCADPDEVDVRPLGDQVVVGGESQPARCNVLAQQLGQTRFVEGQFAQGQRIDLGLVNVQADDFKTQLSHACGVGCAKIPGAHHRYFQRHARGTPFLRLLRTHSAAQPSAMWPGETDLSPLHPATRNNLVS